MSRFNTESTGTAVVNKAGGKAYSQTPEVELVSMLLTSFAQDQFYQKAEDTFARVKELIKVTDKHFVAQAAVYARTQFGMRSISHVVASELARHIGGEKWAKDFYSAIIHRPDDMTEILSYHTSKNGKLTNAMKKGIAKAFDKFDHYSLAKYRGEGKGFKLVDAVNMVHPIPVERNAKAIEALVKGDLKSFDTWESELTKAGQVAKTDEEKDQFKKGVWVKLIGEKKLGYFALLRNLRNIIEQAPEAVPAACELLQNEVAIKKSLVLPFRFVTAFEQIEQMVASKDTRKVMTALVNALDLSLSNVPRFDGETCMVLDVSGSMSGKPSQIGSLFAAILAKTNDADVIVFSNDAKYKNVNVSDSVMTIAKSIKFASGGTNFHSIFMEANKKYDRVIILSDMQGWMGYNAPTGTFNDYKSKFSANPYIYSFDLAHYGSMQFPENKVFCLAGFSDKIFTIMSFLEQDKHAMVNEIKKVVISENK